jgi:mannose-6-phosphate isomerase-like protein (cupin superfamily)
MIIKDIEDTSSPAGANKPDEYVLVPITETEKMKLGRSVRRKGEATPMAIHDDEEEFYIVLKGEGIIRSDDKEFSIAAGQVAYIARNEPHSIMCTSDEPLDYLYVGTWPDRKAGEVPETA